MTLREHAQVLWPTPFLRRSITRPTGFDAALVAVIREHQASIQGDTIGMVDGEKSPSDLLRWQDPTIDTLRAWILDAALELNAWSGAGRDSRGQDVDMIAEAWAVVYQEWGYHALHSHPDSAWSGVYYVSTGEEGARPGTVEFLDPRSAAIARETSRSPMHTVVPEPGLLIAFPSWLQHWVTPHGGHDARICVAFNVGFGR
jgi:uncharacterized protein (TIGR02466 family)